MGTKKFNLKDEILAGRIKGAIFDLDGTLIDSMGVWEKIDIDYLKQRNIPVPVGLGEAIRELTFQESAIYFKARFHLPDKIEDIMAEWNKMAIYEYAHRIQLKEGARKFLEFLNAKEVLIGLATTNCLMLVEKVLKNNEVRNYFSSVVTVAEVRKGKMFPDIYLHTAKKLFLEPQECVVFEDILMGVLSAKKAGMKVVGVSDARAIRERERIIAAADAYLEGFLGQF